jgi:hypothetical protein
MSVAQLMGCLGRQQTLGAVQGAEPNHARGVCPQLHLDGLACTFSCLSLSFLT